MFIYTFVLQLGGQQNSKLITFSKQVQNLLCNYCLHFCVLWHTHVLIAFCEHLCILMYTKMYTFHLVYTSLCILCHFEYFVNLEEKNMSDHIFSAQK